VSSTPVFPMSALVGLEDLVTALVLVALDPAIGGLLVRGDKGSAKTTAARALASLLPDGAPFVELPLGATEDRVVGSVDVAAVLERGEHRHQPGLLAAADGGVLYVDEVNLLPDHLVDVLLDAAATGVSRVERDGISVVQASRFVLVGSMNPEEGELRPQLLDRFGLSVSVCAPDDPEQRAEAVRRRLAFDADPEGFAAQWSTAEAELAARLRTARPVPLEPGVEVAVAELCLAAGVEGLRADLVICRAAAALGGWRGRARAGLEEVAAVAPLALLHRRRGPFSAGAPDAGTLERLIEEAVARSSGGPRPPMADGGEPPNPDAPSDGDGGAEGPALVAAEPGQPPAILDLLEPRRSRGGGRPGRRRAPEDTRAAPGRVVGSEPLAPDRPGGLAVGASVLAAAGRAPAPVALEPEDLRVARREERGGRLLVLAVDASGSMGAPERLEAARAAVLALVADAYQRRDQVAVVTYRGEGAEVALRPTSSTEVALARLAEVTTGGRTPLAAGIDAACDLAVEQRRRGMRSAVVVVTDGRATWASQGDPVGEARRAASRCRAAGLEAVLVDCEGGRGRLGLGLELAEAMGARYVPVGPLGGSDDGPRLARAIEGALG
jgi:magnesium chelatase subunit D